MTRFEYACQSVTNMSIVASFLIATYVEQMGFTELEDRETMNRFMDIVSDDIADWLIKKHEIREDEE